MPGPVRGASRLSRRVRGERIPPAARRGRRFVGGQPLGGGRVEAGRDLEARGGGADGRHLDVRRRRGRQTGLGPAGAVAAGRVRSGVRGGAGVGLAGPLLRRRCGALGGHHQPVAGLVGPVLGGQPGRRAHRRGPARRGLGARVADAIGLGTGAADAVGLGACVADAVGVVAVDPGRRLEVVGQPGHRWRQVAVSRGRGAPTGRGVGLPTRCLLLGTLVLGSAGPSARRGRPPADGTARVVVLTRSVAVLSRGGDSGLPCFTHRALLGRPR